MSGYRFAISKEEYKVDIDKAKNKLKELIFDNGKMMLSKEIDSCMFHNLTHKDTEILGMFCDFTNIHGEDLKNILLEGYLNRSR